MRGIIIALALLTSPAAARDFGQWENQPPHVHAWFQKLMQPDIPTVSCCGEADAYWADGFEVDGDRYVAIITDERPDGPLGRPHRESGEKIVVPNHKIKWDDGNPTGHGIIFIGMGGAGLLLRTAGRRLLPMAVALDLFRKTRLRSRRRRSLHVVGR